MAAISVFQSERFLATFDLHVDTSNEVLSQLACWLWRKSQNRFSTWLLGRPFWISDQNDFNYF